MSLDNFSQKINDYKIQNKIKKYENTITTLVLIEVVFFVLVCFNVTAYIIWNNNFTLFLMICVLIFFVALTIFNFLMIKTGVKMLVQLKNELEEK